MTTAVFPFTDADEARHPVGPDPWWQESIAIHWFDPARRVGGVHRIGHEPGQEGGIIAHHAGVFDARSRYRRNITAPMSGELDARWYGDRSHGFSVADGSPHLWFATDECEVDIRVENLYPLTDFFPRGNASLNDDFAPHHYETSGVVRGTCRIGSTTHEVQGYCHRDHSWGIRRWSGVLAAHRWVSGVIGEDLCFGSITWLGVDGTLSRGGYVVRDGEVKVADTADIVVWGEIDGISHRGGELVLTFGTDELRFTCRALDGFLNEHHGVAWLDKLCAVEHQGRSGYCDFETSDNVRMGSAPIYVCLGAATDDGLAARA
jgi:hypothetical protein